MTNNNISPESQPIKNFNKEKSIQMIMQKITETDGIDFTERHIDEILSQRKEINGFIHKERMQKHERFKYTSTLNLAYVVIVLIFSGIVLYYNEKYFTEVLFALIGFSGGYGIGKSKGKEEAEL